MEKFESKLVEGFPFIILSFVVFWLSLIAYGLLSQ